jgi:hypothetical protein
MRRFVTKHPAPAPLAALKRPCHAVRRLAAHPASARLLAAAPDLAGLAILGFIAVVDLMKFDLSWDTLAYHLPFAALRVGLMSPDQFIMPAYLAARFNGFPALVDYVQGALWAITGHPQAVSLITPLAALLLAGYLRATGRVPMVWTAGIFLAVPALHTALDSGYTDVWTNAFFAIHLVAVWRIVTARRPAWRDVIAAILALLVAVNSKEQYFVLGAASFAVTAVLLLGRQLAGWWRGVAFPRAPLIAFLALSPLVFFSPLRNLVLFGNPIYPVTVTVGGHVFPGTEVGEWAGPAELAGASQPVRYLLSQLDLYATNMRPDGYTNGQGDQPHGAAGFRMGGSLGVLLVTSLALLVPALARRGLRGAEVAALAGGAALLALIAWFPGSNEVRYFSFVEIVAIAATLAVTQAAARAGDAYGGGLSYAMRALLVGAATYTACLSGLTHLTPTRGSRLATIVHGADITQPLDAALRHSAVVCYARPDPRAILFAPLFQAAPGRPPYRLVWVEAASQCPAGSAIIG